MTFFVEKNLALGAIRFGVTPRQATDKIDMNPQLSTGPQGEFVRRHREGFYFGGQDRFDAPSLPVAPSIRSTPFLTTMKNHRRLLALAAVGAVLILLGFLVIIRKGAAGWVEVLLGAALIAIPIVITAQERKKIHEQEERERAEREALEARNRQMLASYTAALERVLTDRGNNAFEQLERETPELPYEIWSPLAQRVVLRIGFDELANWGADQAREVGKVMERAAAAAGLRPEDAARVKIDLYRTVVWHLLADDRLGPVQDEEVTAIRRGFGISNSDTPTEAKAIDQFHRLRGVTASNLPRRQCSMRLTFKEYCIHESADVHVTNRNVVAGAAKKQQFALPLLSDVTVIADDDTVAMRIAKKKKPVRVRLDDAIYTAAMIDLASSIDERPKGFA